MRCHECDAENKAGRRFCAECGVELAVLCPDCGFANDEDDKFCGGCGALLGGETLPPSQPAAGASVDPDPLPRQEAERRHLTILFCDLVGSTALSERLDPEDLREVIGRFQDACAGVIKDFGGYVARLMGDGMLVYFGYPQAQEDAPERAVRAGLGIVERVASLKAPDGVKLEVRVGVATGLVVVGDLVGEDAASERAVVGETPNLAARLQGLAAPNTVVVAPLTEKPLRGLFAFEDLGEHRLKGLTEPVRAYRALHAAATESRFEAYRGASLTPLVGRTEEITFLAERWSRARDGDGQVVTLSGEAGIGKSRILEAVRELVSSQDGAAIHFQCSPHHQSTALYPFTDYLSREVEPRSGGGAAAMLDGLEELALSSGQDESEAAALFAQLLALPTQDRYPTVDEDAQQLRNRTLLALADHVTGLAGQNPLLVVFEDVHWIDPTSCDLLGVLIDRAERANLLILITFRPEFSSPWGAMGIVGNLTLNRLTQRQSAEIALKVSRGIALPPEVVDHIVARTDGVPLFVEEMTKSILDSGLLRETEAGFELQGPISEFTVPETLQDSLMARLDRMAPVKEIAQIGAVIGREFGHQLISRVSRMADEELRAAIDALMQAELVFRRGWPPNEVYVFKHALVQDAAYESLLKEKRRTLHASVARVLEGDFPEICETEPETVALHYAAAGQNEAAGVYWEKAGRRAAERSAHVEATEHFRMAVETSSDIVKEDRAKFFELNMAWAASLRVLGRTEDTLDVLARIQTLAQSPLEKTRVHHLRGNIYFLKGDANRNVSEQELALSYAREAGSDDNEVHALSGLADAEYMRGRMVTAHRYFADLIELARKNELWSVVAGNIPARENTRYLTTGPGATIDKALAAVDFVVEQNHPRAEVILRSTVAEMLADQLRLDEALEQANLATDIAERIGAKVWIATAMGPGARAQWLGGDLAGGEAKIRQAAEFAMEASPALSGPWLLGLLASVAADIETVDEVEGRANPIFDKGCVGHNQIWYHRCLIDAALRFGDWDRASRHADALEAFLANEPFVWSEYFVARGRTLVRVGRGEVSPEISQKLNELAVRAEQLGFLDSRKALVSALEIAG